MLKYPAGHVPGAFLIVIRVVRSGDDRLWTGYHANCSMFFSVLNDIDVFIQESYKQMTNRNTFPLFQMWGQLCHSHKDVWSFDLNTMKCTRVSLFKYGTIFTVCVKSPISKYKVCSFSQFNSWLGGTKKASGCVRCSPQRCLEGWQWHCWLKGEGPSRKQPAGIAWSLVTESQLRHFKLN